MTSGRTGAGRTVTGDQEGRRERPDRPVAHIDQTLCDRSPGCPVSRICPKKAVVSDGVESSEGRRGLLGFFSGVTHSAWKVDESKCTGCLLCARYCPHQAVQARLRNAC